jgi:hypothetical protein
MLFSFGVCCAFSFWAVPAYGAIGIIAANCLNLALRIVFSLHFIAVRVPTPKGAKPFPALPSPAQPFQTHTKALELAPGMESDSSRSCC